MGQPDKDQLLIDKFSGIKSWYDIGVYLKKITKPNIHNPENHPRTLEKILSITEIPSNEEVVELLFYSYIVKFFDQEVHKKVLGIEQVIPYSFDNKFSSALTQRGIYHVLTKEFVGNLYKEIMKYLVNGPIIEIGAGNGKLAHWLNKLGLNVIATDKYHESQNVINIDDIDALKKKPKVVITSWLDLYENGNQSNKSNVQKRILECNSVDLYIEIQNGSDSTLIGVDKSGKDNNHFNCFPVSENVQKYSFPCDLFWRSDFRSMSLYDRMIYFKFDTFNFLKKIPTVYLWQRK